MASVELSYDPSGASGSLMARIELNIPRRSIMGNFYQPPNLYQEDITVVNKAPIDQIFDLRVSVLPSNKEIFNNNPVLFLFREVNRHKKSSITFRPNGKKLVHPTHEVGGNTIQLNHRYRGGRSDTTYYQILDRVTEVPLNINTHQGTGLKEFYGGSDSNPDGTIFPFRPLARYSYSRDISDNNVRFPQPLYQPKNGTFNSGIGIEAGIIQNGINTPGFLFYPTRTNRKYKSPKRSKFGIMLMIDNPDYQGTNDTQNARKIAASNMVMFEVTFKTGILVDPIAGISNKYALDWQINLI